MRSPGAQDWVGRVPQGDDGRAPVNDEAFLELRGPHESYGRLLDLLVVAFNPADVLHETLESHGHVCAGNPGLARLIEHAHQRVVDHVRGIVGVEAWRCEERAWLAQVRVVRSGRWACR